MTREADVVQALVKMADTLVDDYDIVDLLTGLADRCVNLLGVSAAGVMLASSPVMLICPEGTLGLVASSSEAMRLLELFELQAKEGPVWTPSAPASASNTRTWRPGPAAGRRSPRRPSERVSSRCLRCRCGGGR